MAGLQTLEKPLREFRTPGGLHDLLGLSRQNPLWVLSSFLNFRVLLRVHTELWERGQLATPHAEVTHHRTYKTKNYNVSGSNSAFMVLTNLSTGTVASTL